MRLLTNLSVACRRETLTNGFWTRQENHLDEAPFFKSNWGLSLSRMVVLRGFIGLISARCPCQGSCSLIGSLAVSWWQLFEWSYVAACVSGSSVVECGRVRFSQLAFGVLVEVFLM